eukprot:gene56274-26191_t
MNVWGTFPDGFDWWDADDWRGYATQLAKLRLNFVGVHSYPPLRDSARRTCRALLRAAAKRGGGLWIGAERVGACHGRACKLNAAGHARCWQPNDAQRQWTAEPLVWLGPRTALRGDGDPVDAAAYPAGFTTTLSRSRLRSYRPTPTGEGVLLRSYRPTPTGEYCCGAGLAFASDDCCGAQ